jgi:membrane-associated phospholipid phosphatase
MWILKQIGMYGPIIVFIYGVYCLYENYVSLSIFIFFVGVNEIINRILKSIIREERPTELISDKNHPTYYGMPSGHTQHIFFIATYLQLSNVPYNEIVWILSFITAYERYVNEKHTINQVCVGALIGSIIGYGVYKFMKIIKNKYIIY